MAIPISWPSSDDEDGLNSLDALLDQLLVIVRQVLHQRQQQRNSTPPQPIRRQRTVIYQTAQNMPLRSQEPVADTPAENHPRIPLPDVVPESAHDCDANRRKPPAAAPTGGAISTISAWVQVGAELRRIAESFTTERASEQGSADKRSNILKGPSLMSFLAPVFGRSMWTTMAFILGWRLFTRSR